MFVSRNELRYYIPIKIATKPNKKLSKAWPLLYPWNIVSQLYFNLKKDEGYQIGCYEENLV